MEDYNNFFFEENIPEYFWSDLGIGVNNPIEIIIIDITHPKESKLDDRNYLKYRVIVKEDIITSLNRLIKKDQEIYLDIPKISFRREWINRHMPMLLRDKIYNLDIKIIRINKTTMRFCDYIIKESA